jgi:hypothetical protein
MLKAQAHLFAKATIHVGLTSIVAVLWIATAPTSGAVAGTRDQTNAARSTVIHECSVLAGQYSVHDWGNTQIQQYRACMARHNQRE